MRWTPHTTVAAIIPNQDNQFLLVEESVSQRRVFNQPAGHLEKNETFIQAMQREAKEETGWTIDVDYLIGIYHWTLAAKDRTYVRFCFKCTALEYDASAVLDDGIIAAHWLSLAEIERLPNLRSPLVLRCFQDYLAGRRFDLTLIQDL